PATTPSPYTTLFRSRSRTVRAHERGHDLRLRVQPPGDLVQDAEAGGARREKAQESKRQDEKDQIGQEEPAKHGYSLRRYPTPRRSEEHTSELQSRVD